MSTNPHVRSRDNAPALVQERGGVALSLWMTGANETDCTIVADKAARLDIVLEALRDLTHAARVFSTEAQYEVTVEVEDEFIAALGDAEQVVGNDHG